MSPLISIVVLNWNGGRFLPTCLEGIAAQTYESVEVIVVDNGSTDGSLDYVMRKYSNARIIRNKENMGYAFGMNAGIDVASGLFIMALNMDVFLAPSCAEHLVNCFSKNSSIGIVMGKEYVWDNSGFNDTPSISAGPGYLRLRCQGCRDRSQMDMQTYCFGAMGSFPVFSAGCIKALRDQTGYVFDPKFGTGWEDKDVFFRAHHLGFSFLYNPNAVGYHYGSGSVNGKIRLLDKDNAYQIRIFRNRYLFLIKNYPAWLLIRHFLFLLIAEIGLYFYLLIKNPRSIKSLLIAQYEVFKLLNKVFNERKIILSGSILNKKTILGFFREF